MATPSTDDLKTDVRDTRVVIYMTQHDAEKLHYYAEIFGLRSRSTLIVAILERLILGGFAVVAFFKVGMQLQRRAEEREPDRADQFEFNFKVIREAVRPFPSLPEDDDPSPREVRTGLNEIREELVTKPN